MGKGRPQQQEISRSGHTPVDQDNFEERAVDAPPRDEETVGPRPPDNRPGHRPEKDQDKPVELGGAGHGTGPRKRRK